MTIEVDTKIHFRHFIMLLFPVGGDFHFHNTLAETVLHTSHFLLLGICHFYMNTGLVFGVKYFTERVSSSKYFCVSITSTVTVNSFH